MSENAKLTRGSIRGHLVTQTLPMIIGVAAVMSIGLVDAYFIGKLGSDALAAISFIFPISVAITSLGVGVMVGINSVIARALGEGDDERAARRANFGLVLAVVTGVIVGVLLYLILDPLFTLMEASDRQLPLIREYMQPFSLGFRHNYDRAQSRSRTCRWPSRAAYCVDLGPYGIDVGPAGMYPHCGVA